jgi:hypothetical protein
MTNAGSEQEQTMTPRDQGERKILLRGLVYIPLFYAIVQAERAVVGHPFVWWSDTHFWIGVVVPVLMTIFTLILYRRADEHSRR